MNAVYGIALAVLTVAGLVCLARLLRPGSSLADRVVALDTLVVVIVSGIAVDMLWRDVRAFVDLLVVTSLLGFVATVTVARFLEKRGL